jgi:hypothetical protein
MARIVIPDGLRQAACGLSRVKCPESGADNDTEVPSLPVVLPFSPWPLAVAGPLTLCRGARAAGAG